MYMILHFTWKVWCWWIYWLCLLLSGFNEGAAGFTLWDLSNFWSLITTLHQKPLKYPPCMRWICFLQPKKEKKKENLERSQRGVYHIQPQVTKWHNFHIWKINYYISIMWSNINYFLLPCCVVSYLMLIFDGSRCLNIIRLHVTAIHSQAAGHTLNTNLKHFRSFECTDLSFRISFGLKYITRLMITVLWGTHTFFM